MAAVSLVSFAMAKRKQPNGGQGKQAKSKAAKPEGQKPAKPEYVEKIANWILVS